MSTIPQQVNFKKAFKPRLCPKHPPFSSSWHVTREYKILKPQLELREVKSLPVLSRVNHGG